MAKVPDLRTVRDAIAWSYANVACAHAALREGRSKHVRTDWMIRARLFRGMRDGQMRMGSLYDDERLQLIGSVRCVYCGTGEFLSIDHLIPRAAGGGDGGHNLVRACRSCNSSKGSRDVLVWFATRNCFPPLLLLRRYLKIVAAECENAGLIDCDMADERLGAMPFDIRHLPREFPPLATLAL